MKMIILGTKDVVLRTLGWLDKSEEWFDIAAIALLDFGNVPIDDLEGFQVVDYSTLLASNLNEFDSLIFAARQYTPEIVTNVVNKCVASNMRFIRFDNISEFLVKEDKMRFLSEIIREKYISQYEAKDVSVGEFTYGIPEIRKDKNSANVKIGKFCSIADNVTFYPGENHRTDWVSTYPFNYFMPDFEHIKGHPSTKGDIVIGNDVWLASHCTILSGVKIGDGAVVAAHAVVTKDVEPYTVVAGNPARKVKDRFTEDIKQKLLEIKWWNWDYKNVYDAIELLQSNNVEKLIEMSQI